MPSVNNPINDLTSYSNYQYNRNDFVGPQSFAESTNNLNSSINKAWELSMVSAIDNFLPDNYAIYTQMRNSLEDTFAIDLMRLNILGSAIEESKGPNNSILSATQMLSRAGNNRGISNLLNGREFNGPPLIYIDADNGDQYRMFGHIIVDGVVDSGARIAITNYTLETYRTLTSNPSAENIPYPKVAGTQNVDYNAELELYFGPQYAPMFIGGSCSCTPLTGDCANGYRRVTFVKKRNYTPGSKTQKVNGWVTKTDYNPLGDGGYRITVKLGLSRKATGPEPLEFNENVPFDLEVGDMILFGNVDVTTQCTFEPCCVKASPKMFSYCSTTQRVIECFYEDRPYERKVQQANELDWVTKATYEMMTKIRDIILRTASDIMFSDPYYAQGQRLPIPIPGVTDPLNNTQYSDCEIIPTSTRGIFPTIEEFSPSNTHIFTSCNDTCGQYKIERLNEMHINAMQGKNVFNDRGWKYRGDIIPLEQLQASMRQYSQVVPTEYEEAQRVERMRGASFREDAKSFFGSNFDADNTGLGQFRFGGKVVPTKHDEFLRNVYPNTMWFVSDNSFVFFAPNIEAIESKLWNQNYYFPSTGQTGKLVPTIISQSTVPTMINGQMDMKAYRNCGIKYSTYMEYGVHPLPEYLPHMMKFTYGARANNPAFDPSQPEGIDNERYIYGSLQELLDCGCSFAETQLRDAFNYWVQT